MARALVFGSQARFHMVTENQRNYATPPGRHTVSRRLAPAASKGTNQRYVIGTSSTGLRADLSLILNIVESGRDHRVRIPRDVSPERRAGTRFPLGLEVRYTVLGRRATQKTGFGRTIDLSSSGLSFTTNQPLLPGQKLDVSIEWPVLLDGAIKLQLVISGVVVRADTTLIALRIKRHEFRTRRVGLKAGPLEESVG